MSDHPEAPAGALPAPADRRFDAVLFDFHGTLAQVEDPVRWVQLAAGDCGVTLDRGQATVLADRLVTAGRPGGPAPDRVPPALAMDWADRDLSARAHRAAYTGLSSGVACGIEGLPEALYERVLRADGWAPYTDASATLTALRAARIGVAVVSNVGFDIRPLLDQWGLANHIQAWSLSYETGRLKPDPASFLHACGQLRVDPERALMVGDTPTDGGAASAGLTSLLLPAGQPGAANGLDAVVALVR
ncbi:HAD family hydrolase [Pilimelia columellifera]|uniref:HAD family hydrolase n=1 Tax=Pilimelia columellifera TaxID=706574 RepID=UPI003CD07C98